MCRALFLAIPLALSSVACTYDNGDARRILNPSTNTYGTCGSTAQSTIDVDRKIDIDAGQGAGVFLEYGSGGHWTLRTSCDMSLPPSSSCQWDILVTPEDNSSFSNVTGTELELGDTVVPFSDGTGTYQYLASTSDDIDGFTFDSNPGAAVRFDVNLDGACAPLFFFWIGDGALHSGSPSSRLDLVPSAE